MVPTIGWVEMRRFGDSPVVTSDFAGRKRKCNLITLTILP
jgi:hypothetical protein